MVTRNSLTLGPCPTEGPPHTLNASILPNSKWQVVATIVDAEGEPVTPDTGEFVLEILPQGADQYVPADKNLDLTTPDFYCPFDVKLDRIKCSTINVTPAGLSYIVELTAV